MINIKSLRPVDSGMYGYYYQLNSRMGIKIFHAPRQRTINDVVHEAFMLVQLQKTGRVPKFYGIVPVRVGRSYKWGLVVEHIYGSELYHFEKSFKRWGRYYKLTNKIAERLKNEFSKFGVYAQDTHDRNIKITPDRKFVVVDVGRFRI